MTDRHIHFYKLGEDEKYEHYQTIEELDFYASNFSENLGLQVFIRHEETIEIQFFKR